MNILAADIGGTHSRFAWFTVREDRSLHIIQTIWLNTKDSPSFGHLIGCLRSSDFQLSPEEADLVVIAAAGPVERGVYCSPPLISWNIDISSAQKDFGFRRCLLINDFAAQAYATRSPAGKRAEKILPGETSPEGTTAVIGAGTGLGMAVLNEITPGSYLVMPSEGGHATFPFLPDEQTLQSFLADELGDAHVTGNHLLSGSGLTLLHRFLSGEDLSPREVTEKFSQDSVTLAWAARFYGRACRNLALDVLAFGGVYIAGGIAAKNPLLVKNSSFREEFLSSRTMGKILHKIPVYLMTNEESGLWGAALFGLQAAAGKGRIRKK